MAFEDKSLLLQLPDPCLISVLEHCAAADLCSMFNAARAHSKLHQASFLALSNITMNVSLQQHVEGLLVYLSTHGQHTRSVSIKAVGYGKRRLQELPDNLQLDSLELSNMHVQMQPCKWLPQPVAWGIVQPGATLQTLGQRLRLSNMHVQMQPCKWLPHPVARGILQPGATLQKLRLSECLLLDGEQGLAAALVLLPSLQHLSISRTGFPVYVLSKLQHLTFLEVAGSITAARGQDGPLLQPLESLTGLADLLLAPSKSCALDSSMLSGKQHLTRLEVSFDVNIRPSSLATLTQLQHLIVHAKNPTYVLPQLQHLQELTQLQFKCTIQPDAAAFSALTASSKLQCLDISQCRLPAAAWQHIFPAGKLLPHLQSLDISEQPSTEPFAIRKRTHLKSCCPGLRFLNIRHLS